MTCVFDDFSYMPFNCSSSEDHDFEMESIGRVQVERLLKMVANNDMILRDLDNHRLIYFNQRDYLLLAKALTTNTRILVLDLSDTEIDYEWLRPVFEVIFTHCGLLKLVLPSNLAMAMNLTDARHFSSWLKKSRTLKTFEVRTFDTSLYGMKDILFSLLDIPTLENLTISSCSLSTFHLGTLCELLSLNRIKQLDISQNHFTVADQEKIIWHLGTNVREVNLKNANTDYHVLYMLLSQMTYHRPELCVHNETSSVTHRSGKDYDLVTTKARIKQMSRERYETYERVQSEVLSRK